MKKKPKVEVYAGRLIDCLSCEKEKPEVGSMKFHSHHVCADCIKKLNALPNEKGGLQ